jgi:hypothetical protein
VGYEQRQEQKYLSAAGAGPDVDAGADSADYAEYGYRKDKSDTMTCPVEKRRALKKFLLFKKKKLSACCGK